MSLLVCRSCTTRYAVGLVACPNCGNDAARFAYEENEPVAYGGTADTATVPRKPKTTRRRKVKE